MFHFCRNYVEIDYQYKKNWLKSDKSRVHQFISNKIREELNQLFKKGQIKFDGYNVYFFSDCNNDLNKLINQEKYIHQNVTSEIYRLQKYIISNKVVKSQSDELIFYYLESKLLFKMIKTSLPEQHNNRYIQFLIILIVLNLSYIAFDTIKIKVK